MLLVSQDEEKPAHEAFVLSAILYTCLSDRSFSSPESRQRPRHVVKCCVAPGGDSLEQAGRKI